MPSRLSRRLASWLVALAFVAPLPAAALPFGDAGTALFSKLRAVLSSLWWESTRANGCQLDPNGLCASVQRPNGCQLDPDGVCSAGVVRDNGCQLDPNGLCAN